MGVEGYFKQLSSACWFGDNVMCKSKELAISVPISREMELALKTLNIDRY